MTSLGQYQQVANALRCSPREAPRIFRVHCALGNTSGEHRTCLLNGAVHLLADRLRHHAANMRGGEHAGLAGQIEGWLVIMTTADIDCRSGQMTAGQGCG